MFCEKGFDAKSNPMDDVKSSPNFERRRVKLMSNVSDAKSNSCRVSVVNVSKKRRFWNSAQEKDGNYWIRASHGGSVIFRAVYYDPRKIPCNLKQRNQMLRLKALFS